MKKSTPWYEQEDFWATVEPILFSERRIQNAPIEVDKMIMLLGLEPGMKILDQCCGVGRHILEFARRGFQATGVDIYQPYLDRAEKIARTEKLKVKLLHGDMRTFCEPNKYDVVLNYFTSFGFFDDPKDDVKVALNAYKSLRKGGVYTLDMMSKEILAKSFRERDWREDEGLIVLEERKILGNWSQVENRWMVLQGNQRKELHLTLRLYSAVELSLLLTNCGFQRIEVFGDLDGIPYDDKARRLIVAAWK
jgi:SAM-dependent methyltransferase